jgi:hypothetical protein
MEKGGEGGGEAMQRKRGIILDPSEEKLTGEGNGRGRGQKRT